MHPHEQRHIPRRAANWLNPMPAASPDGTTPGFFTCSRMPFGPPVLITLPGHGGPGARRGIIPRCQQMPAAIPRFPAASRPAKPQARGRAASRHRGQNRWHRRRCHHPPRRRCHPRHARYRHQLLHPNLSQGRRPRANPSRSPGRCRRRNPSQNQNPYPSPNPIRSHCRKHNSKHQPDRRPAAPSQRAMVPGQAPGGWASGNRRQAATSAGDHRLPRLSAVIQPGGCHRL
jgi:hypothetical protein